MSLYKKSSTKSVILAGFGTTFLLTIAVVWLSLATMHAYNNSLQNLVADLTGKTSIAYRMRDLISKRSADLRTLEQVGSYDEQQDILTRIENYTNLYYDTHSQLQSDHLSTEENEILTRIGEINQVSAELHQSVVDHVHDQAAELTALDTEINEALLQDIVLMKKLNDLVGLERENAERQVQNTGIQFDRTRRSMIILSLTALLISIMISLFVIKRVTRANRRIAHLASHDDLTGLINRREFESQLRYTMLKATKSDRTFGLMYLDLDRFKVVNDTCGHHAGDKLLNELTTLIQGNIRKGDVLARIGGDEFALIASAGSLDDIATLAEQLRELVQNYVFNFDNQQFTVSLSIGLIPIQGDTQDMEHILTTVDSACYVAKQSGRNRVHVARQGDADLLKYKSDLAGIQLIRKALSEERLELYYQPIYKVSESERTLSHCELLLRIRTDDGKLHAPGEFLPVAEKYNIMHEIDRWVFDFVLSWMEEHQHQYELPKLLVNLSGLSFVDENYLNHLSTRLSETNVDVHRIAFEITETAAVDNLELASHFMNQIRAHGCRFALDDFGTGFSTFSYLKHLPIDYLKIDGTLVQNITRDSVDREMVRAINDIGHTVGAQTIAEYVEDDQTLELLNSMGVDYAQGFGLQKPRPLHLLLEDLPQQNNSHQLPRAS